MWTLNLTQHAPTPDQIEAGVIEPPPGVKEKVKDLLTFTDIPSRGELRQRAMELAEIAAKAKTQYGAHRAMIGGAPYFMAPLEKALRERGIVPVYAFSVRESTETLGEDGAVHKQVVFVHKGFIEP